MTLEEMTIFLVEHEIATDNEIRLVTCITGYNQKTLEDILDVRTGYNCFQQYIKSESI